MIIRKKEHWFKMLFVWHGSVLPMLVPRLLLLLAFSIVVAYFHGTVLDFKVPLNPAPLTLFGFVLALFLGFRNNASYDRFWEGRKLWGALLNTFCCTAPFIFIVLCYHLVWWTPWDGLCL